jgi:large subunit ribosomal protein L18
MRAQLVKAVRQARRVMRVRKRIRGTAERPRLAVYRSHRNIYAQIIDDDAGRTLCALGTASRELRGQIPHGGNVAAAGVVGKALAEKALAMGIQQVCFDRRGRRYHGRIKALAEAARAAGLKF